MANTETPAKTAPARKTATAPAQRTVKKAAPAKPAPPAAVEPEQSIPAVDEPATAAAPAEDTADQPDAGPTLLPADAEQLLAEATGSDDDRLRGLGKTVLAGFDEIRDLRQHVADEAVLRTELGDLEQQLGDLQQRITERRSRLAELAGTPQAQEARKPAAASESGGQVLVTPETIRRRVGDAAIREWARANNYEVGSTGKTPGGIVVAYMKAHGITS